MSRDLQAVSGAPETVARMDERLQVVQRLARIEFAERQTAATADVTRIIADAGSDGGSDRAPQPPPVGHGSGRPEPVGLAAERELHRRHQDAIEERSRLGQAAAAERARLDEEFRRVLGLRCQPPGRGGPAGGRDAARVADAALPAARCQPQPDQPGDTRDPDDATRTAVGAAPDRSARRRARRAGAERGAGRGTHRRRHIAGASRDPERSAPRAVRPAPTDPGHDADKETLV